VELMGCEVPGNREIVERVAEDQVVLLGVLVAIDELSRVAPVGLDRRVVAGQAGRLVVGVGDRPIDLGDVDLGAGIGVLHVPLECVGPAAQEQGLERGPLDLGQHGRVCVHLLVFLFLGLIGRGFLGLLVLVMILGLVRVYRI